MLKGRTNFLSADKYIGSIMNITGKIIEIQDVQQISESFKKRVFVVEYAENIQYPEYISFELIQEKCSILDEFHEGDHVIVHFNLRGRKWTTPDGGLRYFNTLQAWRLEHASSGDLSSAQGTYMDEQDDLPF